MSVWIIPPEWWHFVSSVSGFRVLRQGRAARVVAVKAHAIAGIKLGFTPRTKDQIELGTDFAGSGVARVGQVVAVDIEAEGVNPCTSH